MTNEKKNDQRTQRAAEQIKNLVSKENTYAFSNSKSQLPEHHYDMIQIPKIPTQSKRLSLYGNQLKAAPKKQRSWNAKEKEKQVAIHLKDHPQTAKEINPHRVKLCKLREHFLASRKLKTISSQKKPNLPPMKGRTIDPLYKDSTRFVKDERMEYWEEIIQNREERHFNIGRIIKYLST